METSSTVDFGRPIGQKAQMAIYDSCTAGCTLGTRSDTPEAVSAWPIIKITIRADFVLD
jgi:hypothetical protein